MNKLLITAVGTGLSIAANPSLACGSVPGLNDKDKGNYLCESCSPINGGVAGTASAFIKAEVNPHVARWRVGDSVVVTNGKEWRRYTYAPMYGAWYETSGGNGVGPGVPRNHNGSGQSCSKINDDKKTNTGGSGGSGGGGSSVFAPSSAALTDYWRYYDLGMLPDRNNPTGTVWVDPVNYDAYWNNYYINFYANNHCVYC